MTDASMAQDEAHTELEGQSARAQHLERELQQTQAQLERQTRDLHDYETRSTQMSQSLAQAEESLRLVQHQNATLDAQLQHSAVYGDE